MPGLYISLGDSHIPVIDILVPKHSEPRLYRFLKFDLLQSIFLYAQLGHRVKTLPQTRAFKRYDVLRHLELPDLSFFHKLASENNFGFQKLVILSSKYSNRRQRWWSFKSWLDSGEADGIRCRLRLARFFPGQPLSDNGPHQPT